VGFNGARNRRSCYTTYLFASPLAIGTSCTINGFALHEDDFYFWFKGLTPESGEALSRSHAWKMCIRHTARYTTDYHMLYFVM